MTTFLILQLGIVNTNELVWQQTALSYYNDMVAKHYTQMAAEWKAFYPSYHTAHPNLTPKQTLSVFIGQLVAGGVGSAITGAGGTLGQVPQAAATGAENAIATITNPLDWLKYPADFFYRLSQGSTWVRIGEFVVGAMLLYVGIKAVMTPGGVSEAAKSGVGGAKKTGSAAGKVFRKATPTGRAASVITRHERRLAASKTRQRANVIRTKKQRFTRKGMYP